MSFTGPPNLGDGPVSAYRIPLKLATPPFRIRSQEGGHPRLQAWLANPVYVFHQSKEQLFKNKNTGYKLCHLGHRIQVVKQYYGENE